MEHRSQSNGWQTFLEHWGYLPGLGAAVVVSQILTFFSGLSGTRWIWCYGVGLAFALIGVLLIFHAKLPLYRERRLFTFGSQALPESRRPFYRWGYRCILFAAAVLLGLLWSRP